MTRHDYVLEMYGQGEIQGLCYNIVRNERIRNEIFETMRRKNEVVER